MDNTCSDNLLTSETCNRQSCSVVRQTTSKTKRKPDAGDGGTPKRIRKSNKLGKAESHVTVRKQTKPTKRRRKTTDTYPSSIPYTTQVHDVNHVDQSQALVWKYRWLIVEPSIVKTSAIWDSNFERCLNDGHTQLRPGSNEVVNVQMCLHPEAADDFRLLLRTTDTLQTKPS